MAGIFFPGSVLLGFFSQELRLDLGLRPGCHHLRNAGSESCYVQDSLFCGRKCCYLRRVHITGPGLVHLKRLSWLKELYLSNTPINDAGIMHLKGLINLEFLWLGTSATRSNLVTDADVAELQQALPGCCIDQ